MIRRTRHSTFRSKRFVVAIIACVGVVILSIVLTKFRMDPERVKVEAETRKIVAAVEQRQSERQAAAEQARATLPPDAGIPSDWSIESCAQSLLVGDGTGGIGDRVSVARALFANEDSQDDPDATGTAGKQHPSFLKAFQDRLKDARAKGTLTPTEDSLDLTQHSREEILSAIEHYLDALRPLQEAEMACERGLLFIPKGSLREREQLANDAAMLASPLACRAIFEARRGEVEKALKTYAASQDMLRMAHNSIGYPLLDTSSDLERITDFAWRKAPLTLEQRERVVNQMLFRTSHEELVTLVRKLDQYASEEMDLMLPDLSKESDRFFEYVVARYKWSRYNAHVSRLIPRLIPLLARPPYLAIPAMEELNARRSRDDYPNGLPTRDVVEIVARLQAHDALVNAMPDVTRVAFALKDYKQAHGEYPKSLDGPSPDPIPALPIDPLSGGPMAYESDGKTFTIALREMTPGDTGSKLRKTLCELADTYATRWHAQE